jgi:alkyl hydroperoxide reductase subunit AhpC
LNSTTSIKNRGFEIYQVSIDQEKNEWVNAIREDGLNWINVGDMRGSIAAVNAYNIQTLPFNYLLDKEGVIVGKNLKGPALDKAVGSILK